jgi:hypothetical protein
LREAPDNVLDSQSQREIGRRDRKIVRHWREKQSETLAHPHPEGEQQAGSNQDQTSLAAARDNRS